LSVEANGWQLVHISELNPPEASNVRLQRWVKVIGGIKFFHCDTIYIDGSTEITADVTEMMKHLGDNIALKRHPNRNCYIDEGEACKRLNKADRALINAQIQEYRDHGLPADSGMFETGILIRRFNKDLIRMCELWYGEIERNTHRDQLSVTWALFETGIQFDVFEVSEFREYCKIHKHK
jgi:hypothetical protein